MPTTEELFQDHIRTLVQNAERSLEDCGYSELLISCGSYLSYFLDDRHVTFVPNPHFVHWVPTSGTDHILHLSIGKKPKLYFHEPIDFWLEPAKFDSTIYWASSFDVEICTSVEKIWKAIGNSKLKKTAFLGSGAVDTSKFNLAINPVNLLNRLNWQRKMKSLYETQMTENAVMLGCKGHLAAARIFLEGGSEFEVYIEFQRETFAVPQTVPYEPIVAINEKGAFLHYTEKRRHRVDSKVLLIDAGAKVSFYNSDITRTILSPGISPVFAELHSRLDKIQLELCEEVKPRADYVQMQTLAMQKIATALCETKVLNVSSDEAFEEKYVDCFLPHGLGHQLGIQVHDVGGRQINWEGDQGEPSARFPRLRTAAGLAEGQICTIEPGIYFIKHLLDELRSRKAVLNEKILQELLPLGGIRIEDDVLVTATGHRNLSREAFKKIAG